MRPDAVHEEARVLDPGAGSPWLLVLDVCVCGAEPARDLAAPARDLPEPGTTVVG